MSEKLTPNARYILQERYLRDGETPEDLFRRVANAVASPETDKERWAAIFYEMMSELDFLPNSPTLINAGRDDGCLSACFVISPDDSLSSIMRVASDAAMVEKWGGGIGFGFSKIREAGSPIASTQKEACGVLSVMRLYSVVGETITQGAFRLGAHIGQLHISHPEILDFINAKANGELSNFNISVQVPDRFMEALQKVSRTGEAVDWDLISPHTGEVVDSISVKALWDAICSAAHATGDPGVVFIDRVHETTPNPELGAIQSSNPCVTGDTLVYTGDGLMPISLLLDKTPSLSLPSGGVERSFATRVWCSGVKPVYRLNTSEGYSLKLTEDHEVFTTRGKVAAKDLERGDEIVLFDRKGKFGDFDDVDPILESIKRLMQANRKVVASSDRAVYENNLSRLLSDVGRMGRYTEAASKIIVSTAYAYDGCFENGSVVICSRFVELLEGLQQILLNFGVQSKIETPARSRTNCHRLLVSGSVSVSRYFNEFGLPDLSEGAIGLIAGRAATIEEVFTAEFTTLDYLGDEAVYDLTEPARHSFVANGMLISNCGEEFLEDYGNCCLGSINLRAFYDAAANSFDFERFAKIVRQAVRFLDNVIEINQFPLEKLREVNLSTRRIGLGVMGWADLLDCFGYDYVSHPANLLLDKIGSKLLLTARSESRRLAQERGAYPLCKGSSIRHSSVTTIAPTGSISRIAGVSSGIEPHFATVWQSRILWDTQDGEESSLLYDCPAILRDKVGQSQLKEWFDSGALPDTTEMAFFKRNNSHAIDFVGHIDAQARWQRYITNSVSKTINLPGDADTELVSDAFKLAWRKRIKAVTVYRDGSISNQVLSVAGGDAEDVPIERAIVADRPQVLSGKTTKYTTSSGNLYLTLNQHEDKPFELLASIGKAGARAAADTEAIARLVSLCLRVGVPADVIANQLRGIAEEPVWNQGVLIRSKPDAIAHVLDMGGDTQEVLQDLALDAYGSGTDCVSCEAQGSVIVVNGCMECVSCGLSKCD